MSNTDTTTYKKKILIIEDEAGLVKVIKAYLKQEGYEVFDCGNGREGLELFYREQPDLLILDLMLPGIPGEEIAREIRKESSVPIIMLTARGREDDKLEGLGLGADDYLVKPVSPREVAARVKTVLRRIEQHSGRRLEDIIEHGPLTINTFSHRVFLRGVEVFLTPAEYGILKLLALYPKKVFSREKLAESVFGYLWEGESRTIDAHIKNLRKKLEPDPGNPSFIKTVFGAGYQFGEAQKSSKEK